MKRSILPTPDPVLYLRNKYRSAGTYTRKTPEPAGAPTNALHILPAVLRRESAHSIQIRENVTEVLTTPNRAGTDQIFTGLQILPELPAGLYYGNEVKWLNGKKIRSDALFLFRQTVSTCWCCCSPTYINGWSPPAKNLQRRTWTLCANECRPLCRRHSLFFMKSNLLTV